VTGEMETARGWVRDCRSLCVLTGAGVSAESGVPTFRGPEGLWKRRDPMTLATPGAFASDPREVWEWYQWRRQRIRMCAPNPGHAALAAAEKGKPGALSVAEREIRPERGGLGVGQGQELREPECLDVRGAEQVRRGEFPAGEMPLQPEIGELAEHLSE